MNYWNERTRGLSPYVPGEQPRDRRFIKLNTNENPYPPSPRVSEAILRALSGGAAPGDQLRLYPDPACTELRRAAAEKYRVKPEQVFAGNGSDEVLAFAFGAVFASAGASGGGVPPVLFPDITYSFFPVYAGLWDIPFRTMPLGDDFSLRAGDYLRPAGGVIFPNPNAPTGRLLPLAGVLAIAEYHKKTSVVIVDEAYGPFAGEAESAVPHIRSYPNLLTVHTLSKFASLAGLRVGFAIGNEELIEGLCRLRDSFNSYTLDRLALAAAAAALSDGSYYEGIAKRVIATRERVSAALRDLGFEVIPSRANFIFIRLPRRPGAGLFAALRERGFLTRRFDRDRISGYLRVSIGTDEDMDAFLGECGKIAASGL
ncbi:MAG: aminotransferase class I/II-fold pyridoxal phosphate-dependent enzyme [Spirochaetaceae bacterium]|jgi:histidinol-phosphate aminotransferase|nr:aminotransferase class I/II-fold pyridoxal phosphate-dependent enzyme [Spirochaetaceae bacterium]